MIQINLLPWRDGIRQKKQHAFLISMGCVALSASGLMFTYQNYLDNEVIKQKDMLSIVKAKDLELQAIVKKIKNIEEKEVLINRKIDVIYTLQKKRPEIVHFFYEMAKATPDGVYLKEVKQNGFNISLKGKTESNTRISEFMKSIERSKWLTRPKLDFIKAGSRNNRSKKSTKNNLNDFTMHFQQWKPKSDEEDM